MAVTTPVSALAPVAAPATWQAVRAGVARLPVHDAVAAYVLDIVDAVRARTARHRPLSTRASLQLLAVARAHAVLAGRDHAAPDDVRAVAVPVLAHRVHDEGAGDLDAARRLVAETVASVPAPPPASPAQRRPAR